MQGYCARCAHAAGSATSRSSASTWCGLLSACHTACCLPHIPLPSVWLNACQPPFQGNASRHRHACSHPARLATQVATPASPASPGSPLRRPALLMCALPRGSGTCCASASLTMTLSRTWLRSRPAWACLMARCAVICQPCHVRVTVSIVTSRAISLTLIDSDLHLRWCTISRPQPLH